MTANPAPVEEHIKNSGAANLLKRGFHDFIVDKASVHPSKKGNTCMYIDLLEISKTSDASKIVRCFLMHEEPLREFSLAIGVDCNKLDDLDPSQLLDLPIRGYVIYREWGGRQENSISRYAKHPLQGQKQTVSIEWAKPNPIPELSGDGCL